MPKSPMIQRKNMFVFTDDKATCDVRKIENSPELVIELVDLDHYNPKRTYDPKPKGELGKISNFAQTKL